MKGKIFYALPPLVIFVIMLLNPPPAWGAPLGVVGLLFIQYGCFSVGILIFLGILPVGDYSWKHLLKELWLLPLMGLAIFIFVFSPLYLVSSDKTQTSEYIGKVSAVRETGTQFFGDAKTTFLFSDGQELTVDGIYIIQPNKTYRFVYETHSNLTGIVHLLSIEDIQ